MRVVLDTNVFVSGVFFGGTPGRILRAWYEGLIDLVVSAEIIAEYERVGREVAEDVPGVEVMSPLALVAVRAEMVASLPLPATVCSDADDDKFLACAVSGGVKHVVSGDKALLRVSGFAGIEVVTPRAFVDRYLS